MNARMLIANNLPHELLLTTRQTTKLRNAIENNMSTDIKLSKAETSHYRKLEMTVMKPLAKSVLIPLGLTAASSAADAENAWFWNNNFSNLK